ncbi:hypothetical protein [Phenylobacterium sp.]|uniref:hypothetical protein n=1 Tax=Phenylobacterium sp. TaxID=1871053 RepID=UPI003523729B
MTKTPPSPPPGRREIPRHPAHAHEPAVGSLDMTDHYEDEDEDGVTRQRVLSNDQVLRFIARYWLRRRGLLWAAVGLTLVAVCFDLALPWAAGRLVDALAAGPNNPSGAWRAWAAFVGVYLVYSLIRNVGMRFWNPLAASNMEQMTNEGFKRVQSFAADWHADTFAGATVRRLTGRCGATTRCPTPWSCGWGRPYWCCSGCQASWCCAGPASGSSPWWWSPATSPRT